MILVFRLAVAVQLLSTMPLFCGPANAETFGGNECLENCEGHAAGYKWAEENYITDSSQCSGNSSSFNEGCETFVDDPDRGASQDDDGNEIEE